MLKKLIEIVGTDGVLHISCSAFVTLECRRWGMPRWAAGITSLAIGAGKEIHDKISKRGTSSWKDIGCDLLGTVVGLI